MTTTTTATKSLSTADRMRAALKAAGFKTTQVSVRSPHYGSYNVTIRSADVSILKVEEIVGSFEKIDRCQASGEILLGGNTYVDVSYADDVIAPLKAEITALLMATPALC